MRAIDGDALMETLKNMASDAWNKNVHTSWANAFEDVIDMVEDAPTIEPEPQWIPCSERLPDGYTEALVTRRDRGLNGEEYIILDFACFDDGCWDFGDEFADVLAWMPLPPVYKRDE